MERGVGELVEGEEGWKSWLWVETGVGELVEGEERVG